MENLRNRISVKLVNNEKDYLKRTWNPSYMSHKVFDNTLVAIHESKLTLKLNRAAYFVMCILELSKLWLHLKLHQSKFENLPYFRFHLEIICQRFCIKTPCTFWDMRDVWKVLAYFLRNVLASLANNSRILKIKEVKFSGYCFYMNTDI